MDWHALVKRHFDADRYDADDVKTFVVAGKITAAEYEEITGETYEA